MKQANICTRSKVLKENITLLLDHIAHFNQTEKK